MAPSMASKVGVPLGSMIRPSLRRVPETAPIKDAAGLPWGVVLVPLCPANLNNSPDPSNLDPIAADEVPRCSECFGYINAYCMFERKHWICCLCGTKNELDSRYSNSTVRAGLEELQRGIVDVLEECVEVDDVWDPELKPEERPAVVAVVDVSGTEDFVEVARSGILALLEALPPSTLFGLVTVGSSVGVFDMRSSFPHCLNVMVPEDGELAMALSDVLPAECMLVPLGDYKDNISTAVESIMPVPVAPATPGGPRPFAYGSAIDSVLEMFEEDLNYSLRIISIIGSMPSIGLGALTPPKTLEKGDDGSSVHKLPRGSDHYAKMADRIVALSASVDLFVVAEDGYIGLEALQMLVQCTGGNMIFYSGIDTSALPQDLYKTYSRPFATKGLLRLRCSSGFQVARAYGHLTADDQYDNIYHVASCSSESSFAVDLEFDNPSGVTANLDVQPTFQLAFSYSCIVPVPGSISYQVQKRLRVETVRVDMARQALDLYSAVDSDILASLLCHKIIREQMTEGLAEARLLLQDWLVIQTSRYNEQLMRRSSQSLDIHFSKFQNMQMIPRLVYGMLRGRLLDPVLVSRDERAFVFHLCKSLTPQALTLMMYPKLVHFSGIDVVAPSNENGIPLALESLKDATGVFLLDCYTELCIYYSAEAKSKHPFPPPPDCQLREYIQNIKNTRAICPHVYHSAAGETSETDFLARLSEEPKGQADVGKKDWAGAAGKGYPVFMDLLKQEVAEYLE